MRNRYESATTDARLLSAAPGGKARARRHTIQDKHTDMPRGQSRLRHALEKLRWMAFERGSMSELMGGWTDRELASPDGN